MNRVALNRRFLADLFAGPFRGHAIIMDPEMPERPGPGDFLSDGGPVGPWVDYDVRCYERRLERHEALGDDSVPYARIFTGTEVFAAAFGCKIHEFEGQPPAARPLVRTAREADRLAEPGLDHPVMARIFEFAERVREKVGPGVPISVPDIQSPFDIAALVWNKQDFYMALMDEPQAVKRLVAKCHRLLASFLDAFKARIPEVNLCHCPYAWAPPELGCWLSEDEPGAMSAATFQEFCLPVLDDLSRRFGGLFMHCCATADHQYRNFRAIPHLRGLNRVFQAPGAQPAIDAFSGHTVLIMAWIDLAKAFELLDMARPDTRFLFNMPAQPLDEARRTCDALRARCPRT